MATSKLPDSQAFCSGVVKESSFFRLRAERRLAGDKVLNSRVTRLGRLIKYRTEWLNSSLACRIDGRNTFSVASVLSSCANHSSSGDATALFSSSTDTPLIDMHLRTESNAVLIAFDRGSMDCNTDELHRCVVGPMTPPSLDVAILGDCGDNTSVPTRGDRGDDTPAPTRGYRGDDTPPPSISASLCAAEEEGPVAGTIKGSPEKSGNTGLASMVLDRGRRHWRNGSGEGGR